MVRANNPSTPIIDSRDWPPLLSANYLSLTVGTVLYDRLSVPYACHSSSVRAASLGRLGIM